MATLTDLKGVEAGRIQELARKIAARYPLGLVAALIDTIDRQSMQIESLMGYQAYNEGAITLDDLTVDDEGSETTLTLTKPDPEPKDEEQ